MEKIEIEQTHDVQDTIHEIPLDAEEEEFGKHLSDWEKQFDAWKEQYQSHPDTEGYIDYVQQGEEWRAQLRLQKEQMRESKALNLKGPPSSEPEKNETSASSSKVTGEAEKEEQRIMASGGAANEALAAPAIKVITPSTVPRETPPVRRSTRARKPNPKFK